MKKMKNNSVIGSELKKSGISVITGVYSTEYTRDQEKFSFRGKLKVLVDKILTFPNNNNNIGQIK